MTDSERVVSYADAGVNLAAADALTARLKSVVKSTWTAGATGEFGAFGGRFRVAGDAELVASADGVGTKVIVAAAAGIYDTVGEDLVNHCVNDILTEGAEPLFFLDYFACGRLDAAMAESVVKGVARGCANNGCALIGGETAEMPGVYEPDGFDLAGFIVGRRAWGVPGIDGVQPGMCLVALPSAGLHTNGFSLARRILFGELGLDPGDPFPGSSRTVAEVLLAPHLSYLDALRPALEDEAAAALAHITGGGIPGNLARVLPPGCAASVDLASWDPSEEFALLARESGLSAADLYATLNMGVGMIVVSSPDRKKAVIESASAAGLKAFECGRIEAGDGGVRLVGG